MKFFRILIIPMCVALVLSASVEPKRAHALFGAGDVVFDPAVFGESLRSAISETAALAETVIQTGLAQSDYVKEYILDPLAYYAGRQLLAQAVDQTVKWVNSGFEDGSQPYFLTNPESFFKDTATKEVRKFIGQTTGIDTIYGVDLIKRAIERNRDTYQKRLTYTLADKILTSACRTEQRQYTDADINGLDLPPDYPMYEGTEPPIYNDYDGTTDPEPVGSLFRPSNLFISVARAQTNPFNGILPGLSNSIPSGSNLTGSLASSACSQIGKKLTKAEQKQVSDRFLTDFRYGGWDAWLELTQNPANTDSGAETLASNQETALIQNEVQEKARELLRNGGFLSDRKCILRDEDYVSNMSEVEVAAISPEDVPCLKWDYSTPGSIIKEQISGALTQGAFDIPTDEFSELIAGIVTSVISNIAADLVFRDGGNRASTNVELPSGIAEQMGEATNTSGGSLIDLQVKHYSIMQNFQSFYDGILRSTQELTACQERVTRERDQKTAQFPYLNVVVNAPSFPTTNYPQSCNYGGEGGAFNYPLRYLIPTAHAQFTNACTGGVTWTYKPQQSFISDATAKRSKYTKEVQDGESRIIRLREVIAMNQSARTDEEIKAAADAYSALLSQSTLKREGDIMMAENDYKYLTVDYRGSPNDLGRAYEDLAEATKACAAATVMALSPQLDY